MHFAELPAAARLFLVPIAAFGFAVDRFAIGNLRLMGDDFDLVPFVQSFLHDLQMQFAHALDHQLVRLRVTAEDERLVFFFDLLQGTGNFLLVGLRLRFGRQTDHRRGELNGGHRQPSDSRRQRIARVQIVHLDEHDDITRARVSRCDLCAPPARPAIG